LASITWKKSNRSIRSIISRFLFQLSKTYMRHTMRKMAP